MARRMVTVADVVSAGLCLQCGTCLCVCPLNCIQLHRDDRRDFVPVVDTGICNRCERCVTVCPGTGMDFPVGEVSSADDSLQRHHPDVGFYRRTFLGHAADENLRMASSSGGVVTALLIHLLEAQSIRGVLVARAGEGRPFDPVVAIVDAPGALNQGAPSLYHPVPLNRVLNDMENPEEFAVVGLPCHIHGMRKFMRMCHPGRAFALTIGLFCGINLSFSSLDFLARRAGRRGADLTGISYREGPWPGRTVMAFSNGDERIVDKNIANHLLTVPRCLFCVDHTNELADLSCGDPWLPELMGGSEGGWTAVIARTERGAAMLDAAGRQGRICLREIDMERIIASQAPLLCFKKGHSRMRMGVARWLGRAVPVYSGGESRTGGNPFHLVGNLILLLVTTAIRRGWVRRRLSGMPTRILTWYKALILRLLYTDRHILRSARRIRAFFGPGPK